MAFAQISPYKTLPPPYGQPTQQQASPIQNSYKLYNSGVEQNAGDYDYLMGNYKNVIGNMNNNPSQGQITPQTHQYTQSADMTSALAGLKGLSETGGYSESDIRNLRERGISPIRSVYAGANRDVDRQRGLQGGFSPNYAAVKAKMAREQSDTIANQMTNVNAAIAERVAQNKLQAAPQYASSAAGQSNLFNDIGMQNANTINDANKFNANQVDNNQQQMLQALSGAQSLYGTTPALAQLFGNQAMQAANTQANITQAGQGVSQEKLNSILNSLS